MLPRKKTTLTCLLAAHACATCAIASAQTPSKLPEGSLPVPIMRQATHYSCGTAALLSVLYYWRVYDGMESELYSRLETTPKDGTEPQKIIEGARFFGLDARLQENAELSDLREGLKRGDSVILDLQAWRSTTTAHIPWKDTWEEGHYVVLAGMDEKTLYAMDPSAGPSYAYLPIPEFLDRWHDYEDRHGPIKRYHHLALFIHGKNPLKFFPSSLVRME